MTCKRNSLALLPPTSPGDDASEAKPVVVNDRQRVDNGYKLLHLLKFPPPPLKMDLYLLKWYTKHNNITSNAENVLNP